MKTELVTVGKRGTIVIPASLRKRFGVNEGDLLITKDHGDGILITPAVAVPVEMYSLKKKAEFLLSNTIAQEDYEKACEEVRKLGLNPDTIKHHKPRY
ncbi:MAG: AbrB/MazE/SpoVT family DNA-binding domain-containing protein [Alphaproteobacteria bacterium]|nr:AbrB/MazE/SpoVT family DNA-binding domain-containing protein [Alphaproteobacteria bacterium]